MPPLRHHPHLDNSSELDSEELDYQLAAFEAVLRRDMQDRDLHYLALHYPELTFGRAKVKEGVVKKRDHAFVERRSGITTWADWQKGRKIT